jgi:glycosyltransferase involved in cell wall biosynthesis
MRIAYLVSRYPQVSHTFIQREVEALRRAGLEIDTFSVRRPAPEEVLGELDRSEHARTHALLPIGPAALAGHHLRALAAGPRDYLATLAAALRRGAPGGPRAALWQLFYFAEAIIMWNLCRRRGVRRIHVHFANVAADVAMLATAFGSAVEPDRGWSWSFTMHGPTEFYDVGAHRLAAKARAAAFVVCISDFARSQLMALLDEDGWSKLHVVHCGIDPADYEGRAERPAGGPLRIVCVGRLVPEKGQAVLVDALARVRQAGHDVECTFVGEGRSRARLEDAVAARGVRDAVTFTGALDRDAVRERYLAADAFCLPSFAEGLPVVLMEAMAAGLPVVTTPIAGVPELVEDGRNGLLVAPGRADRLADALAALAADPDLRQRLGAQARETVRRDFNLATIGPALRDLFAERLG